MERHKMLKRLHNVVTSCLQQKKQFDPKLFKELCDGVGQTISQIVEDVDGQQLVLDFLNTIQQGIPASESVLIDQMLNTGLSQLIEELLAEFSCLSSHRPALVRCMTEALLESLNAVAESSPTAKMFVITRFSGHCIKLLTQDGLDFYSRLEILKSTNALLERCPTAAKDRLMKDETVTSKITLLAALLYSIGDYEFQVGLIEFLFRIIPRKYRQGWAEAIFKNELVQSNFQQIRDSDFETDCRLFLKQLNESLGRKARVYSVPCSYAQLGNMELMKPSDPGYTDFWVDFNLGSQRISLFCEQLPSASQNTSQDEDLWETITANKGDIESYSYTSFLQDDGRKLRVKLLYKTAVEDSFPSIVGANGKELSIVFDSSCPVLEPLHALFGPSETAETKCKVSHAADSVCLKTSTDTSKKNNHSNLEEPDVRSCQSSQQSRHGGMRKISVPMIPMITPTRISVMAVPSSGEIEKPKTVSSTASTKSNKSRTSAVTCSTEKSGKFEKISEPKDCVTVGKGKTASENGDVEVIPDSLPTVEHVMDEQIVKPKPTNTKPMKKRGKKCHKKGQSEEEVDVHTVSSTGEKHNPCRDASILTTGINRTTNVEGLSNELEDEGTTPDNADQLSKTSSKTTRSSPLSGLCKSNNVETCSKNEIKDCVCRIEKLSPEQEIMYNICSPSSSTRDQKELFRENCPDVSLSQELDDQRNIVRSRQGKTKDVSKSKTATETCFKKPTNNSHTLKKKNNQLMSNSDLIPLDDPSEIQCSQYQNRNKRTLKETSKNLSKTKTEKFCEQTSFLKNNLNKISDSNEQNNFHCSKNEQVIKKDISKRSSGESIAGNFGDKESSEHINCNEENKQAGIRKRRENSESSLQRSEPHERIRKSSRCEVGEADNNMVLNGTDNVVNSWTSDTNQNLRQKVERHSKPEKLNPNPSNFRGELSKSNKRETRIKINSASIAADAKQKGLDKTGSSEKERSLVYKSLNNNEYEVSEQFSKYSHIHSRKDKSEPTIDKPECGTAKDKSKTVCQEKIYSFTDTNSRPSRVYDEQREMNVGERTSNSHSTTHLLKTTEKYTEKDEGMKTKQKHKNTKAKKMNMNTENQFCSKTISDKENEYPEITKSNSRKNKNDVFPERDILKESNRKNDKSMKTFPPRKMPCYNLFKNDSAMESTVKSKNHNQFGFSESENEDVADHSVVQNSQHVLVYMTYSQTGDKDPYDFDTDSERASVISESLGHPKKPTKVSHIQKKRTVTTNYTRKQVSSRTKQGTVTHITHEKCAKTREKVSYKKRAKKKCVEEPMRSKLQSFKHMVNDSSFHWSQTDDKQGSLDTSTKTKARSNKHHSNQNQVHEHPQIPLFRCRVPSGSVKVSPELTDHEKAGIPVMNRKEKENILTNFSSVCQNIVGQSSALQKDEANSDDNRSDHGKAGSPAMNKKGKENILTNFSSVCQNIVGQSSNLQKDEANSDDNSVSDIEAPRFTQSPCEKSFYEKGTKILQTTKTPDISFPKSDFELGGTGGRRKKHCLDIVKTPRSIISSIKSRSQISSVVGSMFGDKDAGQSEEENEIQLSPSQSTGISLAPPSVTPLQLDKSNELSWIARRTEKKKPEKTYCGKTKSKHLNTQPELVVDTHTTEEHEMEENRERRNSSFYETPTSIPLIRSQRRKRSSQISDLRENVHKGSHDKRYLDDRNNIESETDHSDDCMKGIITDSSMKILQQDGLISGPSTSIRPGKSTLKRKFGELVGGSDISEETETDSGNDQSPKLKPRKLFKSDNMNVNSPDSVCAVALIDVDSDKESEDISADMALRCGSDLTLETGVTTVIKAFGVDIQNQMKARQKRIETLSKSVIDSTQKQVKKVWIEETQERQGIVTVFQNTILQELDVLEKEILGLKEAEDKALDFLKEQLKVLENYRYAQQKRLRNMKTLKTTFSHDLRNAEIKGYSNKHELKERIRAEIATLRKKLLLESQKHELTSVRKCLQTII